MGSIGANRGTVTNRPVRTDITERQLKTHVTSTLKSAGLTKAEQGSATSIRGFRPLKRAGYAWVDKNYGPSVPAIEFKAGFSASPEHITESMDKMEKALSEKFKIERSASWIKILGEYK